MKKALFPLALAFLATAASAQNTGIGTANPTDQLHTTGTVRFEGYRGAGTRLMLMDSSGRLAITGGGPVTASTPQLSPITDNGCASGVGYTSTITISNQPVAILSSKISVRINCSIARDADLALFLVAPNGAVLRLVENNGGTSQDFANTVFSDEAPGMLPATSTTGFDGIYKPKGGLAAGCLITPTVNTFGAIGGGSIIPNGTWILKAYDNTAGITGILNKWEISFTGPGSFASADDNNYVPQFAAGNLVRSNIYHGQNGAVGINTSTPFYPLTLNAGYYGFVQEDAANGVSVGTYTNASGGGIRTLTNTPLTFSAANAATQLELGTGGNLGVGITGATARLHVAGYSSPLAQFENFTALSAGVNSDIYFKTGSNYTGLIRSKGTGSVMANLSFYTNASPVASNLIERLTIADNGYVGVGIAVPTALLDVAGAVKIRGGSPGVGKVLTATSATGDAVWQAPVKVSFRAILPTTVTVATGNYPQVGNYNEHFDEGNNFNNTTGIFTAPQAGLYHFDVSFPVQAASSNGSTVYVSLACSNNAITEPVIIQYMSYGDVSNFQISESLLLAAGDQVQVNTTAAANRPYNLISSNSFQCSFSGYLIH